MNILIVDDSRIIRARLKMLLKSGGYSDLFFAASAFEAYEYLEMDRPEHTGEKIDLILMDIQMPEMDGIEACSRIKSVDRLQDIPVIMVTGDASEESLQSAFEAGAMDYIVKPVRKTELFARVSSLLKLKHETDKRKAHEQELIHEIEERKRAEEIVRKTNKELKKANTRIIESIQYAKRIQQSLLPNQDEVMTYLPDSFFIWKPRDIVGGDIFFTECFKDGIVIAVVDCTGHGVPGALMTMIASSALRRITKTEQCHDPAEILKRLNFIIKTSLQQDTEYASSDDGLDATVCFVKQKERTLTFAGAKLPLFYVQNSEVTVIRGDKRSIGYKRSDPNFEFTNHTIPIEKGMSFYMATDGFWDQMKEDETRRFGVRIFGKKRFSKLLGKVSGLPFDEQQKRVLEAFYKYKGKNERQDDVTVVGFGFKD
ncbi:MAG TPA: response regulator [Desulfobacterales bacterium]|nr:response regulator [Desulfobacterales bacterium]